jgi:hypothetical protein
MASNCASSLIYHTQKGSQMMIRTISIALLSIGLVAAPLQAQSLKPVAVRAAVERQPFAYVADLSAHGFASGSFIVDPLKRLVIEEVDAYALNTSSNGGLFLLTVVTNGVTLVHYIGSTALASPSSFLPLFHQQSRYYADAGSTVSIVQLSVYADQVKFQISGYEVNSP